ncbi:MAG: YfiR family protein [Cytophagaceae bacterium]|jgi:hypothetical protein|nr:YfiR family protein [Cytophagaceae bacterium]
MKHYLAGIVLMLVLSAGTSRVENEKLTCLFVYNFIKYIEWPSPPSASYKLAVISSPEFYSEMKKVLEGKTKGTKPIELVRISIGEISSDIHVLFVEKSFSSKIPVALEKASANTLVVSQNVNNLSKTKSINIYIDEEDSKMKFEINQSQLEKRGFKIPADLLRLGTVVR